MIQHDFDTLTPGRIVGWAYDRDHPRKPISIVILINGVVVGETVANQQRDDLDEAGIGACAYDWAATRPSSEPVTLVEVRSGSGDVLFTSGLWLGGMREGISPKDEMFTNPNHYYKAGGEVIAIIDELVAEKSQVGSILDLACGHGRVLRHLKTHFPAATIACCDINRSGVDYCASTFGCDGFYSNPEMDIDFRRTFDLIWIGSLITHLSEQRSRALLTWMCSLLTPSGMMIVTSHGDHVLRQLRHTDYGLDRGRIKRIEKGLSAWGFGYADYPAQRGYGFSITSRRWFEQFCNESPGIRLRSYSAGRWDGTQDVAAFEATTGPT